ncbi:MAG: sigma-70 family RNA polymerase sigma factor [Anaerolineaceae bacterium]|nr:sigma-70 family RNA polymerase sigma factor [Anaerolineaceae bacterium]
MLEATLSNLLDDPGEAAEDDVLIQEIRHEPARFAILYRRYAVRVYGYLYGRLWNVEDAQDVTTQVFIEVMQSLPRYQQQGNFPAWLFTIVHRRAIDHQRRRRDTIPLDATGEQPSALPDPLDEVIQSESLHRLETLYRQLDADSQELIRLRFAARLSYGQIGKFLGRSEAAIGMAITRLLGKLKDRWKVQDE